MPPRRTTDDGRGAELRFRPHHFLCTFCYRGEGYSRSFAESYSKLAARLRGADTGDDVRIRVVAGPDAICSFCPKLRGEICETEEKVRRLDQAHAAVLGLEVGRSLSWGEAKHLLAERMTEEAFEQACEACGWRPLGICKKALARLRADST